MIEKHCDVSFWDWCCIINIFRRKTMTHLNHKHPIQSYSYRQLLLLMWWTESLALPYVVSFFIFHLVSLVVCGSIKHCCIIILFLPNFLQKKWWQVDNQLKDTQNHCKDGASYIAKQPSWIGSFNEWVSITLRDQSGHFRKLTDQSPPLVFCLML